MKQTITIDVPEGKDVIHTVDENGNIVIKYIDKAPIRSKSWDEFCKNNPDFSNEYYINHSCYSTQMYRVAAADECEKEELKRETCMKGFLSSQEDVEGIVALMQLMRLRDEWVGNWKPDYVHQPTTKWSINYRADAITIDACTTTHRCLIFPEKKMAQEFLDCFIDLIEKAKKII